MSLSSALSTALPYLRVMPRLPGWGHSLCTSSIFCHIKIWKTLILSQSEFWIQLLRILAKKNIYCKFNTLFTFLLTVIFYTSLHYVYIIQPCLSRKKHIFSAKTCQKWLFASIICMHYHVSIVRKLTYLFCLLSANIFVIYRHINMNFIFLSYVRKKNRNHVFFLYF